MPKKIFTQELEGSRRRGRPRKRWKEEVESAGSEKMERVGGRYEKMEGHCSTGQSPQWAVVPMEEEDDDDDDDLSYGVPLIVRYKLFF